MMCHEICGAVTANWYNTNAVTTPQIDTAEISSFPRKRESMTTQKYGGITQGITVMIIVVLLFYYVEVVGTAFVEMLFVLIVLRRTVTFAQNTQRSYQGFLDFSGSVRLFRNLDDELSNNEEMFESDSVPPDFDLPIRLDNVTFAYDGSPPVLDSVNLVIPPKGKVAFVGASGSGKTTLATLLTGILRPTSGVISMGGIPFNRIDQRKLREGIGYVTQESVIFNDTVHNNVSLWDEDPSHLANVEHSARAAHADKFVDHLTNGYSTLLGDNGMKISGGQRQRVAIARELYKDARVLILDEGTSALDSESEKIIQHNIDELRGDTTLVLIAHRLSTVRNSDMIFVLDEGRVVEQGTYDYLYAIEGKFTEMVNQQVIPIRHDRAIIHRCVPEPHPSFPRKRQSTAIGERDCGVIKAKWYNCGNEGAMTRFFQIGFHRCGTTSIHKFFEASGIPSIHNDRGRLAATMFDNVAIGKYILNGYESYCAFSDMELLTHDRYLEAYKLYPQIMDQVPNSKFILNIRDPDKWIMSRLIHPSTRRPNNLSEQVLYRGKRILTGSLYERYKSYFGLYEVNQVAAHMRTEWDSHISSVQDAIPSDRLLVFNIESDSPLALCRFVGLDDSAAEHYGMTNSSDAQVVRFLRGHLPSPLLRAIPKPVKRSTVGVLNLMTHKFGRKSASPRS